MQITSVPWNQFPWKRGLTHDSTLKCLWDMDLLDVYGLYDAFTNTNDFIDKQLAYQSKSLDSKYSLLLDTFWRWTLFEKMNIFMFVETNSYKPINLFLNLWWKAFLEKTFSSRSSHGAQGDVDLIKAELQVDVNYVFDCTQFCNYVKVMTYVMKATGVVGNYFWKRKQKEKINPWIMGQKECCHCCFKVQYIHILHVFEFIFSWDS